ncbi:hypothetical protein BWR60_29025 [Inquilinus limosus]|uniref:Uncharacterized protein n=1 Tax=Inquilinus limosus TaxID=171674 RepID=A0A211ZE68_9PROT|nr:hypothetical protein BWR60_29025 [Inquilinus limosus]
MSRQSWKTIASSEWPAKSRSASISGSSTSRFHIAAICASQVSASRSRLAATEQATARATRWRRFSFSAAWSRARAAAFSAISWRFWARCSLSASRRRTPRAMRSSESSRSLVAAVSPALIAAREAACMASARSIAISASRSSMRPAHSASAGSRAGTAGCGVGTECAFCIEHIMNEVVN